jgi:hypothetical protein
MGIERMLLDQLIRFVPRPTLEEAKLTFAVPKIQDTAIEVAALVRELAIELNTRRLEIENKPPLNWRGFLVGSVTVGIAPASGGDGRHNWVASAAWNTKPHKNQQKFCAERRNGRKLIRRSCICAVGIATVALINTNGDDRSGKHGPGPTLDPCEACRDDAVGEFRQLYQDTLIVNEHPVTRTRTKPRTWSQIFDHHGEVYWASDPKITALRRGR